MIDSFAIFISCTLHIICRVRIVIIFSVTRRSRSHGSESLSEWTFADLTDVTLVSDDTY